MIDQDESITTSVNMANTLFTLLLDEDDMLTFYGAKKLLKSSDLVYSNATLYLSEKNAIASIYMAVNMAVLLYQYAYVSWFLYYTTTISGLKKLYKIVLQNPLLGIFFYLSFYYKLLGETDKEKFDLVAKSFDLPIYEDFSSRKFLTDFINNISDKIIGEKIHGYKNAVKAVIKSTAQEMVSKKIESLPTDIGSLLNKLIKQPDVVEKLDTISSPAVYVRKNNVETESDLAEWADFLASNMNKLKKQARKNSTKRLYKMKLREIVERKTDTGEVICLNKCKSRQKTSTGCYCESDCGSTFLLSGKSWCYVDPDKCKAGKYLPKYLGKTYDYCDGSNAKNVCFTGLKYQDCITR